MSSYYAPCFNRIDFVVIPSYAELSWSESNLDSTIYSDDMSFSRWLQFDPC